MMLPRFPGRLALIVLAAGLAVSPARGDDAAPVAMLPIPDYPQPEYRAAAAAGIDAVVRPAAIAFAAETAGLAADLGAFCATPTPDGLAAAKADFATAALLWATLMPLPFDPLTAESRKERIFFWPDPRGITLRQIQPALADRDPDVTDPATLAPKSVALQGLGAIEYLLYGTGAETLLVAGDEGAFRCAYARAAAVLLGGTAAELAAAIAPGSDFDAFLATPGPGNPLFIADQSPLTQLLIGITNGVELARDGYLIPVLGIDVALARPRAAPLWRSGLAVPFLHEILASANELLVASGLSQLLPADSEWIGASITTEFVATIAAVPTDAPAIDGIAVEGALRDELFLVIRHGDNLKSLLKRSLPRALGLNGFNFADGD